MRVAVGDIGTNTARLLVADVIDGVAHERDLRTEIVGLGRGLYAYSELQPDAIARAVKALGSFADGFESANEKIIVATSASRDARNRESFFDEVLAASGVRPTLISGDREAGYAFAGVSQALNGERITVIDIGGGSTEFVTGQNVVEYSESINMGSVRMTDLHLRNGPVSPKALASARAVAADVFANVRSTGVGQLVGVAGTCTTVSSALLGLAEHDRNQVHLSTVRLNDVTHFVNKIALLTTDKISEIPAIGAKRAPVILGGLLVLEAALSRLPGNEMLVSERDLLHGVAAELGS
jgi:exopolyphosphatase/guanosine-5'-triphosphate,3'-diphosphate pyrophosphatase